MYSDTAWHVKTQPLRQYEEQQLHLVQVITDQCLEGCVKGIMWFSLLGDWLHRLAARQWWVTSGDYSNSRDLITAHSVVCRNNWNKNLLMNTFHLVCVLYNSFYSTLSLQRRPIFQDTDLLRLSSSESGKLCIVTRFIWLKSFSFLTINLLFNVNSILLLLWSVVYGWNDLSGLPWCTEKIRPFWFSPIQLLERWVGAIRSVFVLHFGPDVLLSAVQYQGMI